MLCYENVLIGTFCIMFKDRNIKIQNVKSVRRKYSSPKDIDILVIFKLVFRHLLHFYFKVAVSVSAVMCPPVTRAFVSV